MLAAGRVGARFIKLPLRLTLDPLLCRRDALWSYQVMSTREPDLSSTLNILFDYFLAELQNKIYL